MKRFLLLTMVFCLAVTGYSQSQVDVDVNIPITGYDNKNTFVVIIANENYESESKVDFAINDGRVFREYCLRTLGVPTKNIKIVEDATLGNMVGAIDWIQKIGSVYKSKAKLIFFYSGHGIPDDATGAAYLLPIDCHNSNTMVAFSLEKLYEIIGKTGAGSVTYFIDACFSGTEREGAMMTSARGVAIKAKSGLPSGNSVLFSAASGDETAFAYKEKGHGTFTYFLLKKLQETKGDISYGELADYIKQSVMELSVISNPKMQTPNTVPSGAAKAWRDYSIVDNSTPKHKVKPNFESFTLNSKPKNDTNVAVAQRSEKPTTTATKPTTVKPTTTKPTENKYNPTTTGNKSTSDNLPTGTFDYDDGTYVGQHKSGILHGKGVYTWKNGEKYDGEYVNGDKTGKGVYLWANGDIYEGEYLNNSRSGKGVFTWADGTRYEGDFVNGKRTGKGIYTWTSGTRYEGDFVDGERTGKGLYTWASGAKYEGDFVDGERTGKGVYTWASGTKYEGDFVDGESTGKGVLYWNNGDRYEGSFKKDKQDGEGVYYWQDGRKFVGTFSRDKPDKGIYYDSNGEIVSKQVGSKW